MKNLIFVLAITAAASASNAKNVVCKASNGTVLTAEIIEGTMMAELVNITIQLPNQPIKTLSEDVKGTLYTDITGKPEDVVVLAISDRSKNPPQSLYEIKGGIEGDPRSGSFLLDVYTNRSQPVLCVETE